MNGVLELTGKETTESEILVPIMGDKTSGNQGKNSVIWMGNPKKLARGRKSGFQRQVHTRLHLPEHKRNAFSSKQTAMFILTGGNKNKNGALITLIQ